MKSTSLKLIGVALVAFALPGFAQDQNVTDWRSQFESGATLGTVRRVFSNQKVTINGPVVDLRGSVLLDWELARQVAGGRYAHTTRLNSNLPSTYKGKTATVLTVQVN